MSINKRVVWSEGLFLRPHHFQQHGRYMERYVEGRAVSLRSHAWGFSQLEFERDLLAVGKLGLRSAKGVFPDGTPFTMPEDDDLPPPLEVRADLRNQKVYLGLPLRKVGAPEIDRSAKPEHLVRYELHDLEVRDATASSDSQAILEVAALRTRFLLQDDPSDEYARIPLAHVVECRADRQVVLDDRFIPTVLNSGAAGRLATFLQELEGLLHQRGEGLGARVAASGRGATAEVSDFLLLQAVNRYEPLLGHLAKSGFIHPEDLYALCSMLAGELSTFTSPTKRPERLPEYRHEDLRATFEPVFAAVRSALTAMLEQSAVAIPFERRQGGVFAASVGDRSLFGSAVFVLAARSDMPSEEFKTRFGSATIIGPRLQERFYEMLRGMIRGVPLRQMPSAPRQIPYTTGALYYEFDQSVDFWREVEQAGGLALYVPEQEFPGLKLDLWAIRG
jgi:type VI secretion system protein ImpJ